MVDLAKELQKAMNKKSKEIEKFKKKYGIKPIQKIKPIKPKPKKKK